MGGLLDQMEIKPTQPARRAEAGAWLSSTKDCCCMDAGTGSE